ncbi:phospholipase domain-containing protein, partial [Achromobacter sp.]|uniref:phospholipase domain-containing protein n=1 Tax=Achromobacter sp. TaxID=134375 RepID=UPI003C7944B3
PLQPALARQQPGTRPSRPLPYALQVHARVDGASVMLRFENAGTAGAVLHVYDRLHLERGPRRYTVEAGKQLEGAWQTAADEGRYDLWVLGPNGFHRHCTGRAGPPPLEVTADYQGPGASLRLTLRNPATQARSFRVEANAYGYPRLDNTALAPGEILSLSWDMSRSAGWYDLTVLDAADPTYTRRLAGRIETGAPSTSDPAMGQELILQWTPLA